MFENLIADCERGRVARVDSPVVNTERGSSQFDGKIVGDDAGRDRITTSLSIQVNIFIGQLLETVFSRLCLTRFRARI